MANQGIPLEVRLEDFEPSAKRGFDLNFDENWKLQVEGDQVFLTSKSRTSSRLPVQDGTCTLIPSWIPEINEAGISNGDLRLEELKYCSLNLIQ